ncbi:MAG: TonB-dependent receptor [Pseudomonadota bacterium]
MIRSSLKKAVCIAAVFALAPSWALSQNAVQIDVRAQPLAEAIAELGRETGLQVGIASALSEGKQSTTVRGLMTARQALDQMLQGTGLQATSLGTDGATVTQAVASQQSLNDDDLIGEDIIVSGELIQRTKQDSQTSVAVIRGEDLEQRSDPDLFTVLERTPGIIADGGGGGVSIRGITEGGFGAGVNSGNLVSVQVDGATVSNFTGFGTLSGPFSVWDLEQIEVLRGPQSTQTGRNALAGAIRVRSKDPIDDFEFKLRGELGNLETLGGAFAANIPFEDTGLALRISGDVRKSDGFITNITTNDDEAGATEAATFRAGLSFRPNDDFEAILKYT